MKGLEIEKSGFNAQNMKQMLKKVCGHTPHKQYTLVNRQITIFHLRELIKRMVYQ